MDQGNRDEGLIRGDELSVTIDLLQRRWLFLLVCTVVAVGLGAAYLAVTPATLEFAARVLVVPHDRLLDQDHKFADDKEFLPTQAEIIRSPAVIRKVIEGEDGVEEADPLLVQDLIGRLSAQPLLGTNVISLRLQDADAEAGLRTLNKVIAGYKAYLQTTEQTSHRETIDLLFDREKGLREEIASLQSQYGKMHNDGPLVGQDSDAAEPRARLEAVKLQLIEARSRRIRAASYLTQLDTLRTSVADGTAVSSTGNPIDTETSYRAGALSEPAWAASMELVSRMDQEGLVRLQNPLTQQALLDARARQAALTQQFGEKHPDVRAVRNLIRSLETEVLETIRVAPRILENELAALNSQERELTDAYEAEFGHCKELDAAVIREQHVLAQIKSVQTIHDTVLSQINRFELADEAIANGQSSITVRVLNSPQLLVGETWPQPAPVLGLAAAVGLAAGFALVVAGHWLKSQNRPRGAVAESSAVQASGS